MRNDFLISPKDFHVSRSSFKIPRKKTPDSCPQNSQKDSTESESLSENKHYPKNGTQTQDIRRSPRFHGDGCVRGGLDWHSCDSQSSRRTSRAAEIGYRIQRQGLPGKGRQPSDVNQGATLASRQGRFLGACKSAKVESRNTLNNRWRHADPPKRQSSSSCEELSVSHQGLLKERRIELTQKDSC